MTLIALTDFRRYPLTFDDLNDLPLSLDHSFYGTDGFVELLPVARSPATAIDPRLRSLLTPWEIARVLITSSEIPPVGYYRVSDAQVGGRAFVFRSGAVISTPSILPAYRKQLLSEGVDSLSGPQKVRVIELDRPALLMFTCSYWEWGHWWLEMVYRPYPLFEQHPEMFHEMAFVVPNDAPSWVVDSLRTIYGLESSQIVLYNPETEIVHCHKALLPTMMSPPTLMRFHPHLNRFLDHVLNLCSNLDVPPEGKTGLLFLSRRHAKSIRLGRTMLENTLAVEELAVSMGFEVIAPERFEWREQVKLLANSRVVVGEHGSAMKSLLFASKSTISVCMNYLNDSQAAIAALREQQYICIEAEGFDQSRPDQAYTVDLDRLKALLHYALDAARGEESL